MSEQNHPAVPGTPEDPAVYKVLPDGTVLYKSYQLAEQAARQKKSGAQASGPARHLAEAKIGQELVDETGNVQPYALGGLAELQFTGLIVVILVLFGLSLVCTAIGRMLRRPQPAAVRPSPAPAAMPQPAATAGIHPGLTNEQLVVLLTAAARETLGGPVRIERFRPMTAHDMGWAAKGRSDLHWHRLK